MSNTNHAILKSSGDFTPQELSVSCLPSPGPTQAEGQVCTSALSCFVPFPLHSEHPSRMPSSFPPCTAENLCRLQGHNNPAGVTK